jgi:hypothetical protein
MPKWWWSALTQRRARCQSPPIAAATQTGTAARKPRRQGDKHDHPPPRLRRLSARTRPAVGLALTTIGLFLIIAALALGVIAVIVGAVFLVSVLRGRQRERLTYPPG